jgi:putative chitinase
MNIQDTVQKLRTAKSVPETVLTELPTIVTKFNVTSNLQLAHFLSQCGHESGSFKAITENLNYSDVNRIAQIFRHDVDLNKNRVVESAELENAKKYVKNPKALANFVYANQNGNGNEASGDGFNYRGRGYIQLTGRSNYKSFSDFIGENCVANPDLVSTKYPLASAAFFFQKTKLWEMCAKGADTKTITDITKKINGGTHGLDDRIARFNAIYSVIK